MSSVAHLFETKIIMKNFTLLLWLLTIISTANGLKAQYATVNFDLEKNYFNEGQPLPAGKNLMFTGIIPEGVSRIEIDIYAGKKVDYTAIWKKAFVRENSNNFNLAVNYKLRASDEYDFQVRFFQNMSYEQVNELKRHLTEQVTGYLVAGVQRSGRSIQLSDKPKKMLDQANDIIEMGLAGYRRSDDAPFPGFSQAIGQQLESYDKQQQVDSLSFSLVRGSLLEKVKVEVNQYVNGEWTKLLFSRFIDNYETEQKRRSLSINAGYGGIHLSGDLDDFNYANAPYIGLLLPISSSVRAPKFFQNTSLNLGVLLSDIGEVESNVYSGFVIDQPLFAGLNFKLFQFIGFDAGATILEQRRVGSGPDGGDQNVLIRPFVGLSARFDIAIGLGK
jgi:hypothetical protein